MSQTEADLARDLAVSLDRHPAEAALDAVRRTVLELAERLPGRPSVLRVSAGEITVAAEWPAEAVVTAPVAPAPAPAPLEEAAPPAERTDRWQVCSPSVGVFYRTPEPAADPFVAVGDPVREGQQVAIVEAMKMMIPVQADRSGQVVAILKENGDAVEYGEALFVVGRKDGGG